MNRAVRLSLVALVCLTHPATARVKLVELGWDIPDTAFLRAHWQTMEQEAPFDGVVFRFAGHGVSSESVWSGERWQRAWLEPAVADLKACRWTRFTDNFVRFNASPKAVAWDDDAGWAALAEKAGFCAWLAREGGAKGLALDFEPYGANQWQWDAADQRSFTDTAALARQRGAQFARAAAAEMPEAVLLTLFANSVLTRVGRSDDPASLLRKEHYGLLPAFFDGMLAGSDPRMVLVDGCENGYYLDSVEAYQRAALDMRAWDGPAARLVSRENRARYRHQVQAGFGFYLDMFINPEGNTYYRGPLDGSRLKHLTRNLAAARDAADEYVWVYGEQCCWWSDLLPWREKDLAKTAGRGQQWEKALPGVTRAIDRVRDLPAAARGELARLRAAGQATNLLTNADFTAGPNAGGAMPAGWSAWQHEKEPTGVFGWDGEHGGGAARATHVTWGCFIQSVTTTPGAVYLVGARCRQEGAGQPSLTVRWQTADGKWTREVDDRTFAFVADGGDWAKASGVVSVPEGAGRLVVLLDIRAQRTEADRIWYDSCELFRLAD